MPRQKPDKTHGVTKHLIIGVMLVSLLGLVGYAYYRNTSTNYAADVAKPLEKSFVAAGATSVCQKSDSGHGPDNKTPWYQAYLSIPRSKNDTAALVMETSAKNNYPLTHANTSQRGPINVDDQYVDRWYFNTSSPTRHSDLKNGNIQLTLAIDNPGSEQACGSTKPIVVDENHSVVRLEVRLPDFK
jgi:hypothetical protein